MIPRIKGKVFQVDEPTDNEHNKWGFEMWMTDLGQTIEPMTLGQFGFWLTEAEAKVELMKAAQVACGGVDPVNTHYIDMKNDGVTRRWDKTDEN